MIDDAARAALADRYRVERELGAGGTATVYLAEDLKHHRKVAIKVLRAQLSAVLGHERFLKEIELTANLTHPHILPLLDSGEAGGRLYYVMPYMSGESLRDRLMRQRQLPVDEAVSLAAQIAAALDYAHRQGVIHRDIKPENILLHDDQASVADFGIALGAGTPGTERITGTGVSLGTPEYMSPEQAAGERTLDGRSDIHALGALLYEMLVGDPPFLGSNPQIVIAKVVSERPPSARAVRGSVPSAVDAAITKALAKAPADRFATAAEFAQALTVPAESGAAPRHRNGRRAATYSARIVLFLVAVISAWAIAERRTTTGGVPRAAGKRLSIAVLPFENLATDTGMMYFAAGVQDEILTKLAGLGKLTVISRTSTMQYAAKPGNLKQVANDLGVATILEGSVQRAGDQVRVNVQLIDAASDSHIWAHSYDRDIKNVFAVESDVAEQVADALQLRLDPAESATLAAAPTRDPIAYDSYLKAQHYVGEALGAGGFGSLSLAIAEYEKAIHQDSTFALAYSELAFDQALLFWAGIDRSRETMRKSEANVRKALALQPGLPQAHLVLGYVYRWGHQDIEKALAEYEVAAADLPNSADVAAAIAFIRMMQNDSAQAHAGLRRAMVLDPRNAHWPSQLAVEYAAGGDYASARPAIERALAINSATAEAYSFLSLIELLDRGDATAALAALDRGPADIQGTSLLIAARVAALLVKRDFASARTLSARLESLPGMSALQIAETRGNVLWLAGAHADAAPFYEKAIGLLVQQLPGALTPIQSYAELALANARAGRPAETAKFARTVDSLARRGRIPFELGVAPWLTLAQAFASIGNGPETARALRNALGSQGSGFLVTPALIRADPTWDLVRRDPTFQAAFGR